MLVPVTFKLAADEAGRLERRAKEVPKRTVSSYIRGLVVKDLNKRPREAAKSKSQ